MGYLSETIQIGTVKTTVIQPQKFAAPRKIFHVINHGDAALTQGVFEWSADGITWGTAAAPSMTLASGGEAWFAVDDGRPFWKFSAAVASGSVAKVTYRAWFE